VVAATPPAVPDPPRRLPIGGRAPRLGHPVAVARGRRRRARRRPLPVPPRGVAARVP